MQPRHLKKPPSAVRSLPRAQSYRGCKWKSGDFGIYTYGETVHMFVERNEYDGPFLPGYVARSPKYQPGPVGLKYIDHMVGNVDWGQMNTWVKFYAEVMGFSQIISFDDKDISTEYTALMSKVMSNGNGRIKFPINEPAESEALTD